MACNKRCSRQNGEAGLTPAQQAAARDALDRKDMLALAGLVTTLKEASQTDIRLTSLFGKPQALGAGLYGFVAT